MKLIYGVGFNDGRFPTKINGKTVKEYHLWESMINRCYNQKTHVKNPTYTNCLVSDNFLNYSYFYDWAQQQIGFNVHGWQLDKDIILKGNKLYNENFCAFVPKEINSFFTDRKSDRGDFPIGVCFDSDTMKYMARCCVNGKRKTIGRFDSPEIAFAAYKNVKEKTCKDLAEKWKHLVDPRVFTSMIGWTV
mgnify:FL=1